MVSLFKKNASFFIPYLLFLLVCGSLLVFYSKVEMHSYINRYHCPSADFFFSYWTNLGLGIMIIPVILILAFVRFRYVLISFIGFLITVTINDSLKAIFHSARPVTVFSWLGESLYLVPNVEMYSWNSFPSGHAATGFCMFCLLSFYTKNNFLKTIYFLIALLVSYSRMYLSEHFLQDIYAGSLIGICSAILTYSWIMNGRIFTKFAGRLDKPLISLKRNNLP